ncbi:MAG: hypothetical protein HC842_00990 [Cytophagales bacterium]|nr:hypothetical protein [Cytophagales bacterium]
MTKSQKPIARSYKIIISGGGTGGHIFPAIAIANGLRQALPEAELLFVGALGKMEMEKVPQAGYQIIGLPVAGLQRSLSFKNLAVPFKLLASLWKARLVVAQFRPHLAIGVGGYASGPVLFAATAMRVSALIQEQNSFAGLTNKWLKHRVEKICVAYEGMERYFPEEKIVLTGNPVRQSIIQSRVSKAEACAAWGWSAAEPTLLVMGGSLGARTVNQSLLQHLDLLIAARVQLIWQTGKFYFEEIKKPP